MDFIGTYDFRLFQELRSHRLFPRLRFGIVNDDARSYMQNSRERFELITFSLLDSHTTSSHFSNIRIDNYVYTREALSAAGRLLTPDGVMVVKFQVDKPFIAGRLMSHLAKHGSVKLEEAKITTDDWPFFYQHAPGLPSSVILISCVLILVCWQVMKKTAVPITGISWPFFFLGAGFMLMEAQIVSRTALLFGTTWLVNAITISGLLLLIVAANSLERAGIRLPSTAAYGGLLATIVIAYFVPTEALFSNSLAIKIGAAILVWCSPVFFASIIFIRAFAAARFAGSALGSNLLGALAGGLIESLSLWLGLRALLLLAMLVYSVAFLLQRRVHAPAPA